MVCDRLPKCRQAIIWPAFVSYLVQGKLFLDFLITRLFVKWLPPKDHELSSDMGSPGGTICKFLQTLAAQSQGLRQRYDDDQMLSGLYSSVQ